MRRFPCYCRLAHHIDVNISATITLHNPYIDFTDPLCASTARCVNSARRILSAYYALSATSLDISRLHPFVTVGLVYGRSCSMLNHLLDLLVSCSSSASPALQVLHRNK
jgi:hypothetical protein